MGCHIWYQEGVFVIRMLYCQYRYQYPATRIPNSSSSVLVLVTKTACAMDLGCKLLEQPLTCVSPR